MHACIEAAEALNLYSGTVTLDAKGTAVVHLASWFGAINTDYRYHLTAIGAPAAGLYIATEIANNQFTIAGGTPGLKVSWIVMGVRQDAWAVKHPMVVEEDKSAAERGLYLNPDLFGAAADKDIFLVSHPRPSHTRPEPRQPATPALVTPAQPPQRSGTVVPAPQQPATPPTVADPVSDATNQ